MKKVLSVLCMALLAGGMIFTSCTKSFTITVNSNNDAWGTVTGGGTFNDQATATLTATPNAGYEFEKWQDGNTQNPRAITVSADETYTAYFKAATPGVKVTFKSENWNAGVVDGILNTTYHYWDVYSMKEDGTFPVADVAMNKQTAGSTFATADSVGALNSDDFQWVEYYEQFYLTIQENPYGDWWAKSATVNISSFDATALKLTADVDANMFSSAEAFVNSPENGFNQVGVDAASTAQMKVKITNVSLNSSKNVVNKKKGANGNVTLATR